VTVELYTAFWSLSLYDIEVPREQYAAQLRAVSDPIPMFDCLVRATCVNLVRRRRRRTNNDIDHRHCVDHRSFVVLTVRRLSDRR
jgi:hypothetical protein